MSYETLISGSRSARENALKTPESNWPCDPCQAVRKKFYAAGAAWAKEQLGAKYVFASFTHLPLR